MGWFSSITKAVSDVVKHPVESIGHAVEVAGRKVGNTANDAGLNPLGDAIKAASRQVHVQSRVLAKPVDVLLDLGPAAVVRSAVEVVEGQRIDRALGHLVTRRVNAVRDVLPYVQSVLSFVPGVGTGLSGAIGAAVALSQGKTIDQAFIEAAKSAIPGGPIAQQVFAVAVAAAQGKPVDQLLINALPIAPAQKQWVVRAVNVGKAAARGGAINQALYNEALGVMNEQLGEAIQAAVVIGKAQALQQAAARAGGHLETVNTAYNRGRATYEQSRNTYHQARAQAFGMAREVRSQARPYSSLADTLKRYR